MMDKVVQDGRVGVKEALLQRDQERKAKIKNLKEEKELSSPDQLKHFQQSFEENIKNILDDIKLIENKAIGSKDLPQHFNKINKDIQILNKYFSVSSAFLTNYNAKKCLETIEEIESKVSDLKTEFLPQKKFGFKGGEIKVVKNTNKTMDEVDAAVAKVISLSRVSCGFVHRKGEKLSLNEDVIANQDVELKHLENCTVLLFGNAGTISICNVFNCKILSGPVSTSVFVENCKNIDLVVACQQLRIHSTSDSRFYIHVTSKAIIEDTVRVNFAPYNLKYEGIGKHFEQSGVGTNQNNWNKVDDFNWLASDVVSPNWKVIAEEERVENWTF